MIVSQLLSFEPSSADEDLIGSSLVFETPSRLIEDTEDVIPKERQDQPLPFTKSTLATDSDNSKNVFKCEIDLMNDISEDAKNIGEFRINPIPIESKIPQPKEKNERKIS